MWGENVGGQLAQRDHILIDTPSRVLDATGNPLLVAKVAATNYSTYCTTTSGFCLFSCFVIVIISHSLLAAFLSDA
jgi:hypothetical protein